VLCTNVLCTNAVGECLRRKRNQLILSLLRLSELKKHVKNLPPHRVCINFDSLDAIPIDREA
jgi:hypothetical protein